jgi:hypothetical protein
MLAPNRQLMTYYPLMNPIHLRGLLLGLLLHLLLLLRPA